MDNDLSNLAKNITEGFNGKKKHGMLESVARLLSDERGKRVLEKLLSDGGGNVRRAAEAAKNGDVSGVEGIISSIAETAEGRELLRAFGQDFKK